MRLCSYGKSERNCKTKYIIRVTLLLFKMPDQYGKNNGDVIHVANDVI